MRRTVLWTAILLFIARIAAISAPALAKAPAPDELTRMIEADWLRQAPKLESGAFLRGEAAETTQKMTPQLDAAGAVDGVINGKWGFHTDHHAGGAWWRVDLESCEPLDRVVIYNRADGGAENRLRHFQVLVSNDDKKWAIVYEHDGTVFRGFPDKKPLVVPLEGRKARFVKIFAPAERSWLHLDEVQVYGTADSKKNIALKKPATQSGISNWSYPPGTRAETDYAKAKNRWNFPPVTIRRETLDAALDLAQRTVEFVEKAKPLPEAANKLAELRKRVEQVVDDDAAMKSLYLDIRRFRRETILSHPKLQFDRLLINKRSAPMFSHQSDQYLARYNRTCPGPAILDDWKTAPRETLLLADKLPAGAYLHPDLSPDATRLMISYANHADEPRADYRRFFIWEVGLDGTGLRQITGTASDPLEGVDGRETVLIEDFDPCYLPDGGIAFVSTRNQGGVRCHHGGRYCPTYTLYRCESDGSRITPLAHGEANEWDPSVLSDGRIIWTRWDYINRHDTIYQSLWTIHPDGTGTAHFYGNATINPCSLYEARQIPGTHEVVATAGAHHSFTNGSIVVIDPREGQDGPAPITRITPETPFPETETWPHTSWPEDSYATPFPVDRDLFFAAWSPYKMTVSYGFPPENAFAVYLVDTLGGRELIYRDAEMSCFAPTPVVPREEPPVVPSMLAEVSSGHVGPTCRVGPESRGDCPPAIALPAKQTSAAKKRLTASLQTKRLTASLRTATFAERKATMGTFYVQDVYRGVESVPRGTFKKLRVVHIYAQPTQRVPDRSLTLFELPKRIVGTAPVAEDGSVAFEAPAGVPLLFQLVDKNDMAVMSMRSFVYLQPGEHSTCTGCHEPRDTTPVSLAVLSKEPTIHRLKPPKEIDYEGGLAFMRTVQPVLDRYCIECHGLEKTEGDMNLLGTMRKGELKLGNVHASTSYLNLVTRPGLVSIAIRNRETPISRPKDYFSHAGRLGRLLLEGDENHESLAKKDPVAFRRMIYWLDLNAQYFGDYSWNKREWLGPVPEGEKALRAYVEKTLGPETAKQPYAALVNTTAPEESRALLGPLSAESGGWGRLNPLWKDVNDAGYAKMRDLVLGSIEPMKAHDVNGTCDLPNCECRSCWVRKARAEYREKVAGQAAETGDR